MSKNTMKHISIIIFLSIFLVAGCLESSPYQETSVSELMSDPAAFEGKLLCFDGVIENDSISGIFIERSENFTGDYGKDGVLASVCGLYSEGLLKADSIDTIVLISTEKDVYHSNETMNVHVDFTSTKDGNVQLQVSGVKNAFGRPLIDETRDVSINRGTTGFDFVFKTPSCEECSALQPGEYTINATVNSGDRTFETYKKITLEREGSNVSEAHTDNLQIDQAGNKTETVNKTALVDIEQSDRTVTVQYFYDPACQKCAKASPVVDEVVSSYGSKVYFSKHNVLTDEGLQLARKYRLPGVPSVVIKEERLIAYEDYGGDTGKLKTLLREAIDNAFTSTASGVSTGKQIVLSVPSVFVVGFLAGFNPCLLAILAFIASVTLSTTGKRRNVLLIVLMFSLGIFVTYLIVGIGILRIIEQSVSLQATITNAIIVLITLLGVWHVYDAYHLRKNAESSFYTPKAFVRLTESVTKKVSLPAAFFIGALFSLIKAPCVGAVYFVILDMVRSGDASGILYLASYNLGVVFPVFIIGAGIAFGLDPEKVETFRKERRSAMRLITGVTLIGIAVLMYAGVI